jgi:linoleate 10R-lipoxygenase
VNLFLSGYTISRAILADAIALTRGDRFYTADFTPYNLTTWGFADCQRDPAGFGFGSMLGRLLLRTLPTQYTYNSVYTWFPLKLPNEMKTHLEKLKLTEKYDLTRPGSAKETVFVTDYKEVTTILNDKEGFTTPYASRAEDLIKGDG